MSALLSIFKVHVFGFNDVRILNMQEKADPQGMQHMGLPEKLPPRKDQHLESIYCPLILYFPASSRNICSDYRIQLE